MTKLLLIVSFMLFATVAEAQTQSIYIAATARGGGTGADCADALAYPFFNASDNWAAAFTSGKISPGTTVHACGTFSGAVRASTITNIAVSNLGVVTVTSANTFGVGDNVTLNKVGNARFLNGFYAGGLGHQFLVYAKLPL